MSAPLVPGPFKPPSETRDPYPWARPWSGERAQHTGYNLSGSGFIWSPRSEFDELADA